MTGRAPWGRRSSRLLAHALLALYPRGFRVDNRSRFVEAAEHRWQMERDRGTAGATLRAWGLLILDTLRAVPTEWRRALGGPPRSSQATRPTAHLGRIDDGGSWSMGRWLDELRQDVRFALRSLRRTPAFTAVAMLTLSVGIGANTAIFSVVQGVLLRPLPYDEPDRLVFVRAALEARDVYNWPISPRILLDMREQSTLLESVEGVFTATGTLAPDGEEPIQIQYAGITPNLFSTLGVRPRIGRDFTLNDAAPIDNDDDENPGSPPPSVIILSHDVWEQRFGGDETILGRSISFRGDPHEVIGIMEPGFELLMPPDSRTVSDVDAWTAPRFDLVNADRRSAAFEMVARLRPGATVAQAQAQMDALELFIYSVSETSRPAGYTLRVVPMRDDINAEVQPVVLALLGAVGFLLLIACANVSNLLLVRASGRGGELAVRAALGGGRGRLLRQLLTESLMLAMLGVIPGVALAVVGLNGLLALGPPEFPRMDSIGVDLTVLLFAVGVSLAAAVLFGMVPAVQASRSDVGKVLHDRGGSPGLAGRSFLRNGIIVAEVALSLVLLIGAGLMVRSFVELRSADPGFDTEGLLTFELQLQGERYEQDARIAFVDELRQRLYGLPGVEGVSAATALPLLGETPSGRYGPQEVLEDITLYGQADYRYVHLDYMRTMGTTLLEGRTFEPSDFAGEGAAVVMIDELVARRVWPQGGAVGRTLIIRMGPEPEPVQVVGVVEHQRSLSPAFDSQETVYFNARNVGDPRTLHFAVRSRLGAAGLAVSVRSEVAAMDPGLPVSKLREMSEVIKQVMAPTRFALVLISVFAGAALALASVGLYSVLAYIVRQRTAEIGLRMALGAQGGSIRRLILWQGVAPTLTGVGLGIVSALWLTRSLSALLIGVTPTDPATYAATAALFIGLAVQASLIPAYRATAVDPLSALRTE